MAPFYRAGRVPGGHSSAERWRGRDRTCSLRIQSPAFCQLNYPPLGVLGADDTGQPRHSRGDAATLASDMGSLIKKRRKRMRKKKHKKMLKATRWQRRSK
jgi:hypothetical protein